MHHSIRLSSTLVLYAFSALFSHKITFDLFKTHKKTFFRLQYNNTLPANEASVWPQVSKIKNLFDKQTKITIICVNTRALSAKYSPVNVKFAPPASEPSLTFIARLTRSLTPLGRRPRNPNAYCRCVCVCLCACMLTVSVVKKALVQVLLFDALRVLTLHG